MSQLFRLPIRTSGGLFRKKNVIGKVNRLLLSTSQER